MSLSVVSAVLHHSDSKGVIFISFKAFLKQSGKFCRPSVKRERSQEIQWLLNDTEEPRDSSTTLSFSMCLLRSVSVSLVAAEVWLQLVRISSPGKCWSFPECPLSATYSLPPSRAAWHDPTLPAPEGISQNVYSLEPSLWFVCDWELSVLAEATELTFCFSLLLL